MKTAIIGDGGWGTALALVLDRNGHRVTVWGAFQEYLAEIGRTRLNRKFLPGVPIPEGIEFTAEMGRALEDAGAVILASPAQHYRSLCRRLRPLITGDRLMISAGKGLENSTGLRLSSIVTEMLETKKPVVLSGPSHAEEVAARMPTSVVAASPDLDKAGEAQRLLMGERFRVYTHDDLIGVELGGALKNVIAIAAGICEGLGFGDNTKAALLTRGMVEIARLGTALGARRETFWGLSGIGDLMTTAFSPYGRNRRFGKMVGGGMTVKDAAASTEMVIEGIETAGAVFHLARRKKVDMPICREVYAVLREKKPPLRAVRDLMTRAPKHENDAKR